MVCLLSRCVHRVRRRRRWESCYDQTRPRRRIPFPGTAAASKRSVVADDSTAGSSKRGKGRAQTK